MWHSMFEDLTIFKISLVKLTLNPFQGCRSFHVSAHQFLPNDCNVSGLIDKVTLLQMIAMFLD